jgi:P4 family phage/plasmid primase-like protien
MKTKETNTVTFNRFKNIRNNRPFQTEKLTIAELLERWGSMKHMPLMKKSEAEAFSFCEYESSAERKKRNILGVSAIVLDVDLAMTMAEVEEVVEQMGERAFVAYSTYSSEPDQYKVRFILPLAEPVSAASYEQDHLALRAAARLGTPPIDPVSCRAAQIYYVPSSKPGSEDIHFLCVNDNDTPWTLADFPELSDEDRQRLVGRQRSRDEEALVEEDDDGRRGGSKKLEIFQAIDKFVDKYLSGVEPIFAEEMFFIYDDDGYWQPYSLKKFEKILTVDIFEEKTSLDRISTLLSAMKKRCYMEVFPTSERVAEEGDRRYLVCMENGTVDPVAGESVDHSPDNYLRTQMNFAFDPQASCPRWLLFLDEIFEADEDRPQKILLLQEFMGYLLIPCTRFQAMLWLYGRGANGKSVINAVISLLLGEENVSAIPLDRLSKRFQSAQLAGKLANITHEVSTDSVLEDVVLKQAVAGDRIQGERKGKDPFYFASTARFVMAMNHFPRVRDTSHGFFRRIQLITFNRIFKPEEQDRDLLDTLKRELAGIFAWARAGLQRLWEQDGFTAVPSSQAALNEFLEESNPVALFVRDMVIRTDNLTDTDGKGGRSKVLNHDVYRYYHAYCRAKGYMPLSDGRFGREMATQGLPAKKSSSKNYRWLKLRTFADAGMPGVEAPEIAECRSLENEVSDLPSRKPRKARKEVTETD